MNVAIYIQANDDKDANQYRLNLLIERVKSEGRQYKIFSELSDKKGNQPLKDDLLSRIYKQEFDTILLYRITDWTSYLEKLSSELNDLYQIHIRIISLVENFDSVTPTGGFYLKMLLAFSEFEKATGSGLPEESSGQTGKVNHHFTPPQTKEKIINADIPGWNHYLEQGFSSKVERRIEDDSDQRVTTCSVKFPGKSDSFDLISLAQACLLTGYSRHTIYQLTSKKLIPHFKRPNGRRIFFSKRILEQWIMSGGP